MKGKNLQAMPQKASPQKIKGLTRTCRLGQARGQFHQLPHAFRPFTNASPTNGAVAAGPWSCYPRESGKPIPIYAHPERAAGGERQIKQLDAKLVTGYMISKDQAVVRFDSLAHSFTLRASRLCLGLQSTPLGRGMLLLSGQNEQRQGQIKIARARQKSPFVHTFSSTSS